MLKKHRIWGTLDPFFETGPILGRMVANATFLQALLTADPFDEYHFFLSGKNEQEQLEKTLLTVAPTLLQTGRITLLLRRDLPTMLAQTHYHCFHVSDCIVSQPFLTRMRNRYSAEIFPITGLTHSLSYAHFGTAFLHHLWPGTTRRDSIICTSRAGQEVVKNYFSWLRDGFGLTPTSHPGPRLARIPLAVDAEALTPGPPRDATPVRILVFGRISHHSKMDIVPLIRAVHRLIQDGLNPQDVEIVLAGWVDDKEDIGTMLTKLAANAGIALRLHVRPDDEEKITLFQSADIFVSIADNPQETFGITLVEAGAFGLPVVASAYDGYTDIVKHGETGLLVPTIGPAATPDVDLEAPLTFDSDYHLRLAQRTAVSIPALAEALKELIASREKRQAMGHAARVRIEHHFSWPSAIARYVKLWDTLWDEPVDAAPLRNIKHPLAPEFGHLFGHYTSETLNDDTVLQAGRTGEAYYHGRDFPNIYAGLGTSIDMEIIKKLVFFARKPVDTHSLIRKALHVAPHVDEIQLKNHILWALKQDILEHSD
ncbi:glycosyltransferase [Pseudodesulfovibrio sp. JC047]|uniref:glycosyltransferase family 4 protein n=1 Tax=Pseudodesulfovibrio sp. JC047 TaxID=2683199 RepID=UPI0013D5B63B|nr:glycosyltransferase family 4 protein [Pseudodesulfovibrio sp. JC047]NDV20280.1 glycosyltransferase [Pseudodesulfovibrio sp. JC047]